jgi:hypothetical protein
MAFYRGAPRIFIRRTAARNNPRPGARAEGKLFLHFVSSATTMNETPMPMAPRPMSDMVDGHVNVVVGGEGESCMEERDV